MSTQPIKVAVTAKREHADKFGGLSVDGIHINSRWIHFANFVRPVPQWLQENFDDIVAAHFLVLYVEPGDRLKTSLIEVGYAIAWGKKILIAGDRDFDNLKGLPHKDVEPWMGFTHQIKITGSIAQTFQFIKDYTARRRIVANDGKISYPAGSW